MGESEVSQLKTVATLIQGGVEDIVRFQVSVD